MNNPPNFNALIAKHFGLEIPEGFQALPAKTPHSRHAGNANFLAKKVGDDLVIGYVFTDHLTWSWGGDFSDSKVHHFSNSEHRQSHIDDLKQDGTAYYPFYLTGNLQAVYQERIATEGQDAANDFLKRTGRRLVADYDRWIKRDVYGAAIETWKQKGGLVTRDDSTTVMPAGCESRPAFLGLEAAAEGLREAMAQRCRAPRAARQAAPDIGEMAAPS